MKTLGVVSVLLLTLLLANLSAGEAQVRLQPSELCSDQSDSAIATFEDANLEAAIRAALSVGAQDDLTCGLVSGLTDLEARDAGIESLVGIQNLTNLTNLDLWPNSITDISSLSGLTSLTTLDLGDNSITDISALSGLTSLAVLWVNRNSITDIGPLSGLTNLTFLNFRENSVSDISSLSGLTRLTNLDLTHNSISDIGVLSGMTGMETLRLYNNPISDISALRGLTSITELHVHDLPDLSKIEPLLTNTGLGAGDAVILMNSGISCADAAALSAKGVSVGSLCVGVVLREWWWAILAAVVVALVATFAVGRTVLSGLEKKRHRILMWIFVPILLVLLVTPLGLVVIVGGFLWYGLYWRPKEKRENRGQRIAQSQEYRT